MCCCLPSVALMEGMAVAKSVVLDQPTKPDYWAVASAVFSNPEIATVVGGDWAGIQHTGQPEQQPRGGRGLCRGCEDVLGCTGGGLGGWGRDNAATLWINTNCGSGAGRQGDEGLGAPARSRWLPDG